MNKIVSYSLTYDYEASLEKSLLIRGKKRRKIKEKRNRKFAST